MLETYLAVKLSAVVIIVMLYVVGIICFAVTYYRRWKRLKDALDKTDSNSQRK